MSSTSIPFFQNFLWCRKILPFSLLQQEVLTQWWVYGREQKDGKNLMGTVKMESWCNSDCCVWASCCEKTVSEKMRAFWLLGESFQGMIENLRYVNLSSVIIHFLDFWGFLLCLVPWWSFSLSTFSHCPIYYPIEGSHHQLCLPHLSLSSISIHRCRFLENYVFVYMLGFLILGDIFSWSNWISFHQLVSISLEALTLGLCLCGFFVAASVRRLVSTCRLYF